MKRRDFVRSAASRCRFRVWIVAYQYAAKRGGIYRFDYAVRYCSEQRYCIS